MAMPADEIAELTIMFDTVEQADEGGITYFRIRNARLPAGCTPDRCDLLFCPRPRDGYSSRLFFSVRPQARRGLNWNAEVRILNENWFAHSWNPGNQKRLAQILAAHLEALK